MLKQRRNIKGLRELRKMLKHPKEHYGIKVFRYRVAELTENIEEFGLLRRKNAKALRRNNKELRWIGAVALKGIKEIKEEV